MRTHVSVLGVVIALTSMVSAQSTLPATADSLTWLSGCWQMTTPDGVIEEQWTTPAAGAMLAVGRTVKNNRMTEWEFLQIKNVNGTLAYVAKPSGQAEATFPLLRATSTEVVFEDLAHDFPQRVIYRKNANGSVTARIEGPRNGQTIGIDFPYSRCKM